MKLHHYAGNTKTVSTMKIKNYTFQRLMDRILMKFIYLLTKVMYKNIQIYNYICNPAEELIPVRWSGVLKY